MFREPLPLGCPPVEAEQITEPRIVYRIVQGDPPTDDDFWSQQATSPDKLFRGVTECQARGLSVFDDLRQARSLLATPRFRGCFVCQVCLTVGSGYIQRTGRRNHFTWWPFAEYAILEGCLVIPS